jgi:hypothetical protein
VLHPGRQVFASTGSVAALDTRIHSLNHCR